MIRHHLLIPCVFISLGVCAGSALLWAESYNACIHLYGKHRGVSKPFHEYFVTDKFDCWVDFDHGRVNAGLDNRPATGSITSTAHTDWSMGWTLRRGIPVLNVVEEHGYQAEFRGFVRREREVRFVSFSLAWVILVALPLPAYALVSIRRRRGKAGHCTHCGYDLRATLGRCPECGAIPANPTP